MQEYLLHRKDRLMHPVPSKPSFLQVAEELRIERDSAGSGASFATDAGGLEAGQKIERSSKSLSALKPVRRRILSPCAVTSDMLYQGRCNLCGVVHVVREINATHLQHAVCHPIAALDDTAQHYYAHAYLLHLSLLMLLSRAGPFVSGALQVSLLGLPAMSAAWSH